VKQEVKPVMSLLNEPDDEASVVRESVRVAGTPIRSVVTTTVKQGKIKELPKMPQCTPQQVVAFGGFMKMLCAEYGRVKDYVLSLTRISHRWRERRQEACGDACAR
jgi:hypothetical protein